jgi:hypothetical protein
MAKMGTQDSEIPTYPSAAEKDDKVCFFCRVAEECAFRSAPNIEEVWLLVLACQEQKSWTALH